MDVFTACPGGKFPQAAKLVAPVIVGATGSGREFTR